MLAIRFAVVRVLVLLVASLFLFQVAGCGGGKGKESENKKAADGKVPPATDGKEAKDSDATKDAQTAAPAPKNEAISLFDGKTMGKWKGTNFGGEGEVEIKDGQMLIRMGSPLSGVTWQGEPPAKMNYEISLEAQRVDGDDFFVCLTVPVNDNAISLVLGGWGGTLVGLSSIDGQDASENEYTQYMNFKREQWYKVRMVVKEKQIQAFIDDKLVIDANIEDRKVETRIEVDVSKPLGIANFATTGAYRNIQMKKLE